MDELESEQKKKTALELLDEAKKGKELKAVDHAAVQYIPFRKNLFIVPRALSKLNDQEVKARRDDLQIKVRGKGCPPPVETWEQCGLSDRALQVLEKHALAAPFPIQRQAIPAIMCGRDVIGVAKTG
jgi:ATP-dependent RNA helicase DDX46/PRP5